MSASFSLRNIFRQEIVHPKDETPQIKLSGVVYAGQCSGECSGLGGKLNNNYTKHMAQERASSSGQDAAVHLHLRDRGHFCKGICTFWTEKLDTLRTKSEGNHGDVFRLNIYSAVTLLQMWFRLFAP